MASLRVAVIRYDEKVIHELTMDQFMAKLISKFLGEVPDLRRKLFMSKDKMDEELSSALLRSWIKVRTDLFSVGFKLRTWVD